MGRRTLFERCGIAEVISADLVVARGFYHLTVDQDLPDDEEIPARDGNGLEVAKQGRGYLEIWHGSLPIEPMHAGDIVLRVEGGHTLSAGVGWYVPGARVADFVCTDPIELERLLPSRRLC